MSKEDCALSVEETNRLIEEILAKKSGAVSALERLTTSFSNLIQWQARKFHLPGIHEDLVQEGYLALLQALAAFDVSRGVKFSTFATKCIRHRMVKLVESETKHLSNTYRHRSYPDDQATAEHEGRKPTRLEELVSCGSSERAAAEELGYRRVGRRLGSALERLTERQRQAIVLNFFDDQRPSVIASRLRVSRPRVTALLQSALKRMQVELQAAA